MWQFQCHFCHKFILWQTDFWWDEHVREQLLINREQWWSAGSNTLMSNTNRTTAAFCSQYKIINRNQNTESHQMKLSKNLSKIKSSLGIIRSIMDRPWAVKDWSTNPSFLVNHWNNDININSKIDKSAKVNHCYFSIIIFFCLINIMLE